MDSPKTMTAHYNDTVVRQFSIMAVVWGVVGMLVGVFIAAQLAWPDITFGIPWLSYGRLRPLHTNAVIFAFGGTGLIGTSYYVVQRTCQTRLFLGPMAAFTFWGWQLVIVAAAITLPLTTWYSRTFFRASGLASRLSTVPSGSLAKASSVGANTVNGPSWDRASSRPAACTAAASVVKPASCAVA